MITLFMLCILMNVTYCRKLLVGKYTTVEIGCPFEPMSWFSDKSFKIVSGRDVNPNLKSKYGIGDSLNLLVYNFTDGDQGRYTCQGILNKTYQQHTVVVNLCNIPEEISDFSFKRNTNGSESKRKLLCKEYTNNQYNDDKYHQANVYVFKNQTSQEYMVGPNEKTFKGKIMEYKCLILNADKCVTNNNIFQLKVQYINFMQLSYTFAGIAAVLVVILLFAGAVIITMARNKRQLATASDSSPIEHIRAVEDEIQYREPVVPDHSDIIDSVNPHSVEMTNYSLDTNDIPNSTYSGSLSSDYESIDSRSGNTDTSHERDVVIVDNTNISPNNSIERGINSDIHQYVNTNIMNPYEQLKNQTRDIHTYEDLNDEF